MAQHKTKEGGGSAEGGSLALLSEYDPRLTTAHPMRPQRFQDGPIAKFDMQALWRARRDVNCPLPTGTSHTVQLQGPEAVEFSSSASMQSALRKQLRSPLGPSDKYRPGSVTSHDLGWHTPATSCLGASRRPVYGIRLSEPTKYVDNMKATGAYAAQRLVL
mmetsp:Transcript_25231/g.75804  ORF Transcript_25231/g.75804 Transcript_25231/m.75804 type:complete len:161 (-) Transcript_25231:101-583(-)